MKNILNTLLFTLISIASFAQINLHTGDSSQKAPVAGWYQLSFPNGVPYLKGFTGSAFKLINVNGSIVGTTDVQTLINKTVNGVAPSTFSFIDPTSSIQTQFNSRLIASNNLSDLLNASTARGYLGLGSLATQNANAVAITGGTVSGITSFGVVGNGTFDSGSGTNILTLRDGTLSKTTGGNWSMSGNLGVTSNFSSGGYTTAYGFATSTTSLNSTGTNIGMKFQSPAFTANDGSTAASGTVGLSSNFSLGIPTLTATNTGVTTTNAANLYIAGAPVASTNQTITNPYALYVASGNSYFGGIGTFTGNLLSSGGSVGGTAIIGSGNRTRAAGVEGPLGLQGSFQAYTNSDNVTVASTTTPLVVSHGLGSPTWSATNASQTYTNGVNLYVAGAPTAGTNVTITNPYSLYVNSGSSYFGGIVVSNSYFQSTRNVLTGNTTAQPSTNGTQSQFGSYANNDATTAASGTLATVASHGIGTPTFTALNTAVTYTNAANLYVAGPPVASTNVTITNPYSLYVASGNSFFAGTTTVGNLSTNGQISFGRIINSANTAMTPGTGGTQAQFTAATNNDGTTAASGIVATNVSHGIASPIWTATNTGVTYTIGANLYVAGPPVASTNVTITNPYSLYINSGASYLGGGVKSSAYYDLPASDASGNGQYRIGNLRVLHNYGTANIFVGGTVGNLTLTGTGNTVLGASSANGLTSGSSNTFIGTSAGTQTTSGANNVYIGNGAGYNVNLTTSGNNTFIGTSAGKNITGTTYSNVTLIGNDAGNGEGNLSNIMIVGNSTTPISIKTYGSIQSGSTTSTSTATPNNLDLGGTYSSTAGANLKVKVSNDGTNVYGFGVSANQLDYSVPSGAKHNFYIGGASYAGLDANGLITTQYRLGSLNTAPASSTATGTLGEIRVTAGFIYVCTATNTWVRATLSTF